MNTTDREKGPVTDFCRLLEEDLRYLRSKYCDLLANGDELDVPYMEKLQKEISDIVDELWAIEQESPFWFKELRR